MIEKGSYVPVKNLARWFVNRVDRDSGELITQLKVQKMVYYADAWFLANFDRPLISEDFECWAHGPVVPSLYTKYRNFGWDPLPIEKGPMPDDDVVDFLEAVFDEYGQYGAKKLEKLTHAELPWIEARADILPEAASSNIISKLSMRNFYGEEIGKKAIKKL